MDGQNHGTENNSLTDGQNHGTENNLLKNPLLWDAPDHRECKCGVCEGLIVGITKEKGDFIFQSSMFQV